MTSAHTPNPGQPGIAQPPGQMMTQMHPMVSGPGGPQGTQGSPSIGGMPAGAIGPGGAGPGGGGPSAHALSHLNPGQAQHILQQQQMCKSCFPTFQNVFMSFPASFSFLSCFSWMCDERCRCCCDVVGHGRCRSCPYVVVAVGSRHFLNGGNDVERLSAVSAGTTLTTSEPSILDITHTLLYSSTCRPTFYPSASWTFPSYLPPHHHFSLSSCIVLGRARMTTPSSR